IRVTFDTRHLQTVARVRGIGRYTRNLLAAFARLAPADVEWTLLRLRTFSPADPSPLPPHRDLATVRLRRPELSMLAIDPIALALELLFTRPDVYHAVQLSLPLVARCRTVITIHDLAPLRWPAPRDRVVLAGFVTDPELAALYAASECLLHPALLEGFGLTPLESLAAGTPVVGFRAGAVEEVVGDAGVLTDPDRDGALGDAL